MYYITRYNSRNWAVYSPAGELVCVTLYRKGALNVAGLLNAAQAQPSTTYAA